MGNEEEVFAAVSQHLQGIRRSGPDHIMAFCPFHDNTRTPAFSMSLTKGLYLCFSCHEKGNLETFLRKVGGHTQGYEILFEELEKFKPAPHDPIRPELRRSEPIPEGLLGMFQDIPVDLENEGFTEETLSYFEVGVDYQHNRIVFPIRNHEGTLVGFSGRAPNGFLYGPRYKIYDKEYLDFGLPEQPPLNKKELIWNYNRVFPRVFYKPPGEQVILVEGFKGVMWLHQHGYPNTMAVMGSFISKEHVWLLEHLGASVYLMFDNDQAGRRATEFAGEVLSRSIPVFVVDYPEEFKQPTDLPPDVLHESIQQASNWFNWKSK